MIRGQKRPVLPETVLPVSAKIGADIHNRFDIEVIRNGMTVKKAYAENIICNQLWTRLLAPNTYFNNIHFGTGSGTPTVSDTSLFTHLGTKAVSAALADTAIDINIVNGWMSFRRSVQLIETEYVGSTLTEVGIAYGSASANLCTHAMLKDMNGNSVSITKTNIDIINIYATVFVHWAAAGYDSGAIKIFENFYTSYSRTGMLSYFLAGCNSTYPSRLILGIGDGNRSSGAYSLSVTPTRALDAANRKITYTYRVPAANANSNSGLRSFGIASASSSMPAEILADVTDGASWYSGTEMTDEAIGTGDGTAVDFNTAFAFVKAGAKIYVNGVEQTSGVSVDCGRPFEQYIENYFEILSVKQSDYNTSSYELGNIPYPGLYVSKGITGNIPAPGSECICENPFYSFGLTSFHAYQMDIYASDDLNTWYTISAGVRMAGTVTVSATYKYCRYWKFIAQYQNFSSVQDIYHFISPATLIKNIHFGTPPASGAVITADYTTVAVAKDTNHVFDISIEIALTEKTS